MTRAGSGVRIRQARRADLEAIVRLLADDGLGRTREIGDGDLNPVYATAFDAIAADPRSSVVVAELDGAVIGCLELTYLPSLTHRGGERAQIEGVRVATETRGRGIGGQLVGWAVEQARERGCRMVQLMTDKRRLEAQRFYASLGFVASHEGFKLPLP